MNEEEKRAIERIKEIIECFYCFPNPTSIELKDCDCSTLETILNLIEKLQKENEKYKRLSKMNLKNAEEFKDNMCEHRCLLKSENSELKARLDELSKNN